MKYIFYFSFLSLFHIPLHANVDPEVQEVCESKADPMACMDTFSSLDKFPNKSLIMSTAQEALKANKSGNTRRAMQLIDMAISVDEKYPLISQLYALKGKYHDQLGNTDLAINSYTKAISTNPDWDKTSLANLFYKRGNLWEKNNQISKSYSDLEKAVDIDPNNHMYVGVKSIYAIRLGYSRDRFCPELKRVNRFSGNAQIVNMTKQIFKTNCN